MSLLFRLTEIKAQAPNNLHFLQKLTNLHDPTEHGRVVHGAAVPPPLPELVLALLDAHPGTLSDVRDVILVQLAQFPLALQRRRD